MDPRPRGWGLLVLLVLSLSLNGILLVRLWGSSSPRSGKANAAGAPGSRLDSPSPAPGNASKAPDPATLLAALERLHGEKQALETQLRTAAEKVRRFEALDPVVVAVHSPAPLREKIRELQGRLEGARLAEAMEMLGDLLRKDPEGRARALDLLEKEREPLVLEGLGMLLGGELLRPVDERTQDLLFRAAEAGGLPAGRAAAFAALRACAAEPPPGFFERLQDLLRRESDPALLGAGLELYDLWPHASAETREWLRASVAGAADERVRSLAAMAYARNSGSPERVLELIEEAPDEATRAAWVDGLARLLGTVAGPPLDLGDRLFAVLEHEPRRDRRRTVLFYSCETFTTLESWLAFLEAYWPSEPDPQLRAAIQEGLEVVRSGDPDWWEKVDAILRRGES